MTDDGEPELPPDPFPDLPALRGEQLGRDLASVVGVTFGALLHIMVGALLLVVDLLAPRWAALAIGLLWLSAGILLWRLRRRPLVTLLVPFATLGVVWLTLETGRAWLGWAG